MLKLKKYKIKEFPTEDLRDVFWQEEVDGYEFIKKEILETTRWGVNEAMYFKYDNKIYCLGVHYELGDNGVGPFEYQPSTIACVEQIEKEVLVTQYESVLDE